MHSNLLTLGWPGPLKSDFLFKPDIGSRNLETFATMATLFRSGSKFKCFSTQSLAITLLLEIQSSWELCQYREFILFWCNVLYRYVLLWCFSDNVLKIGISLRQLQILSKLWLQNCDHNHKHCVCLWSIISYYREDSNFFLGTVSSYFAW